MLRMKRTWLTQRLRKGEQDASDEAEDLDAEDYEELLAEIIPEETVTLDVFDQLANYSGEQIGWFGQIMLEKFNVKTEYHSGSGRGL